MSRTTDWILELEDRGIVEHNGYEYVFVGTTKEDNDKNLSLNGTDKNKYDIINTKKT